MSKYRNAACCVHFDSVYYGFKADYAALDKKFIPGRDRFPPSIHLLPVVVCVWLRPQENPPFPC